MRFLNRYDLQTQIRRREQASIYSAIDSETGLAVYLALIDGANPAHLIEALRAELPLAQNADPHLLTVLGYSLKSAQEEPPYVISEALAGRSLRELAGDHGLAPTRALAFCYEAARCMESLHGRGVVHGAVHIDEFVAAGNGTLVLLTPALSDLFGPDLFTGSAPDPSDLRDYTAPEMQAQYGTGGKPTVAGDVYGLGMLLYHLLTGVTPGSLPGQPVASIAGPLTPPMNESPEDAILKPRLRRFIQVATARDPVQRWPDISTFIEALDQIAPDRQVEEQVATFKLQIARGEIKERPRAAAAEQPPTVSLTASSSGNVYKVQAPRTTVGVVRASGFVPDISLNNESSVLAQYVSQHHLDLVYTGGRWYARPYEGARNPTFVDGRELQKGALYPLHEGSELALPALKLVVHLTEVTAQVTLDKE